MNTTPQPNFSAAIYTQNKVNAFALAYVEGLKKAISPFVGKKILTQGGEFAAEFKKTVTRFRDTFPNPDKINFFFNQYRQYSLTMEFGLSYEMAGTGGCEYRKYHLCVCSVDLQVLKEIYPPAEVRTTYEPAAILATKIQIEKLEAEISGLKNEMGPFTELGNW